MITEGNKQKKAESEMASRSLNVLKKFKKALNHNGFWPFLLRRNLPQGGRYFTN